MRGLWLANRELTFREDLLPPEPGPGEALVRVLLAGICNTDLEMVDGYYPFEGTLGHEFVGWVEKGPDHLTGRRVVGEINIACRACAPCKAGLTTHCEQRQVLGIKGRNGAFAEALTLPVENLHPVPESVPPETATFTEPLAAALEIQEQIRITDTDRVLLVGAGKLGQLIAQTLIPTGCRLRIVGRRPGTLQLGGDRELPVDRASDILPASADIAIECTGNPEGFAIARRALRPRGVLVLKSTYVGRLEFDASALVVDEITLVGSRCGPFAPALALLESGQIDVVPLIGARLPLERGLEAFRRAREPGALKILLEIGDPEPRQC
jgi:threonine dehydrogenase-like Zn-dependent dehydrogenase